MLVDLYKHRKTIYYQSFLGMLECPVEMRESKGRKEGRKEGVEKEVDVARSRRRAGATADRDLQCRQPSGTGYGTSTRMQFVSVCDPVVPKLYLCNRSP